MKRRMLVIALSFLVTRCESQIVRMIDHGTTIVTVVLKDSILLAADTKVVSEIKDYNASKYILYNNVLFSGSGGMTFHYGDSSNTEVRNFSLLRVMESVLKMGYSLDSSIRVYNDTVLQFLNSISVYFSKQGAMSVKPPRFSLLTYQGGKPFYAYWRIDYDSVSNRFYAINNGKASFEEFIMYQGEADHIVKIGRTWVFNTNDKIDILRRLIEIEAGYHDYVGKPIDIVVIYPDRPSKTFRFD